MSVKDIKMIINVQNGTNGDIIDSLPYEDFEDYCSFGADINVNMNFGEYIIYKRVCQLIKDKHDVVIRYGYKN